MSEIESDRTVTTAQAATILGISRATVVRFCDEGQLPYAQPGKHRILRLDDVLEFKAVTTHRHEGDRGKTKPMTPERLAEIRVADDASPANPGCPAARDRLDLLAEVQRLTDELDYLNDSRDQAATREIDLRLERDEARALCRVFLRYTGGPCAVWLSVRHLGTSVLPRWLTTGPPLQPQEAAQEPHTAPHSPTTGPTGAAAPRGTHRPAHDGNQT